VSSGICEERAHCAASPVSSTELEDVTEVEYRQLRLENVVLVGVSLRRASRRTPRTRCASWLLWLKPPALSSSTACCKRRPHPDPATYLGRGKAQELSDLVAALGADTVIADTELAPSQRRALEDVVKVKVIDRTTVILDIFSQHAKSREGKAQVELAQLEYLLPRLRGWGDSMSRQAGGQVGAGGRAWDRADPVRRRSSSTDAASAPRWRCCAARSGTSRLPATPSAPSASATRSVRRDRRATRTPASQAF
jgi:GTP-binding protein HflX